MSGEIDLTKPMRLIGRFYNSSSESDIDFGDKSHSHSDEFDRFKFDHPGHRPDFDPMRGPGYFARRFCNETDLHFDDDFRSMFINSSIVALLISGLSALVNLTLVVVIGQLLRKQLVPKKSYTLLLNLCAIDATISLAVMTHSALSVKSCSKEAMGGESFSERFHKSRDPIVKHALLTATVAAPALGYICLCVFEWIAVRYPFYYASKVTRKKILQAIACTWLVAILVVLGLSSFHLMAFKRKSELDSHRRQMWRHAENGSSLNARPAKEFDSGFFKNFDSQSIDQSLINKKLMSAQKFSSNERVTKTDSSHRPGRRPIRDKRRHKSGESRESHKFFNRLFISYHACELIFNFVCLMTVVLCYFTVVRVVHRRQTKMRFIRGLRMHFILFVCTTIICIITNCIHIYFNDFMNRQAPPWHKPKAFKLLNNGNPQAASGSSSMDSDELNQDLILEKCANMAKMREMKNLLFSSIVAGFLSLTRLLADAVIYLVGNVSIRQFLFGGMRGLVPRTGSISVEEMLNSSKNSSTKSNEESKNSIKMGWAK